MKKFLSGIVIALGLTMSGSVALAQQPSSKPELTIAIFAGGCFWCVQADFDKVPGVVKTEAGYTGGHVPNPTYKQVSAGGTGHVEAVRVTYDPSKVSYEQLLDHFWKNIDPTVSDRQFCDVGSQYRSVIFYLNEEQRKAAVASKEAIEKSGVLAHVNYPVRVKSTTYPPEFQLEAVRNAEADAKAESNGYLPGMIKTEIIPATTFYPAEEYHQDYYKKNPIRYKFYRTQCGRDARLKHIWGEAQH